MDRPLDWARCRESNPGFRRRAADIAQVTFLSTGARDTSPRRRRTLHEMKVFFSIASLAAVVLVGSGCAGSHTTSAPPTSTQKTRADFAVARVQAGWPLVRVFPRASGAASRCVIPGPGISRGIPATCRTTISTGAIGPTVVTFTESWPGRLFRYSGSGLRTHHHSWRFDVEGSRGRVILVKQFGDFPPQSAE